MVNSAGEVTVTPVMSGPPSEPAPTVKPTEVVSPVPNTSPDQPPGPLMSPREPAFTSTFSPPSLALTLTLTVPASLTNETLPGLAVLRSRPVADPPRVTSTRPPPTSVVIATVSELASNGNVTFDVPAATGAGVLAGVLDGAVVDDELELESALWALITPPPTMSDETASAVPTAIPNLRMGPPGLGAIGGHEIRPTSSPG